jgi:hypothetical protein
MDTHIVRVRLVRRFKNDDVGNPFPVGSTEELVVDMSISGSILLAVRLAANTSSIIFLATRKRTSVERIGMSVKGPISEVRAAKSQVRSTPAGSTWRCQLRAKLGH